jgi:hypothetical protein
MIAVAVRLALSVLAGATCHTSIQIHRESGRLIFPQLVRNVVAFFLVELAFELAGEAGAPASVLGATYGVAAIGVVDILAWAFVFLAALRPSSDTELGLAMWCTFFVGCALVWRAATACVGPVESLIALSAFSCLLRIAVVTLAIVLKLDRVAPPRVVLVRDVVERTLRSRRSPARSRVTTT